MADGRLGRCKACHKSEIHKNYLRRLEDPVWREKEMDRQRLKQANARKAGKVQVTESSTKASHEWGKRNQHKKAAHSKVRNAIRTGKLFRSPCEKCGADAEAHHDDYSKPLTVRWLCAKHHNEHHVEMRRLERFTRDQLNQATTPKEQ
jgi:hypothetical protein